MASKAEGRVCDLHGCDKPLPKGRRRYCSDKCRTTASMRRYRAKQRGQSAPDARGKVSNLPGRIEVAGDGRVSARTAPNWFVESGWYEAIDNGAMTHAEVAERVNTTRANVSRWFEHVRRERIMEAERAEWQMPPEAREALEDFAAFRARYFRVARGVFKGRPYVTRPFHLKWIRAVLDALPEEAGGNGQPGQGGQQLILSPPRHGKSELLAHFCIWLMIRNPDVVIIWIAKAERQAKEVGSLIRDNLERNELLIEEMLGPGGSFKPVWRAGGAWRDDELEIATRTIPQKAPTFRSIGRGGNLQSVDADFIVTDDIEDHDSTRTQHQRESTRQWLMTEVESRKEIHTAWLCIGSRNHPDDVLAYLLDLEDWHAIVESAHDPGCERPIADPDAHVDCMLWAEKFPYSELAKKLSNTDESIVAMRYLNDPISDGLTIFVEAQMRSPDVLDRSRVLGQLDLPDGYDLLGSIDPGSMHQVAQLWAFSRHHPTRFLIDVRSIKGGMDAWEDLVRSWLTTYQLRRWVVEDNALQSDYVNRRDFVKWRHEHGVHVHAATTGKNKHSLSIGVGSMAPLYTQGHIVLPYGDAETQGRVDAFIREHVNYDPDVPQTGRRRFDRVLAAWFANAHIDQLVGTRHQVEVHDATPAWMEPDGLDWIEDDSTLGGWV